MATDMTMTTEPASGPARRGKVAGVTMTEVATHLDLSRQRIAGLADEGVLPRLPDGKFDLDACRIAYLRWLRTERRSARSAVDGAFTEAKTRCSSCGRWEAGTLVPKEAAEHAIDVYCATVTTELLTIGARVARTDLQLRRRIDAVVLEVRRAIHAAMGEKVAEFQSERAAADDD